MYTKTHFPNQKPNEHVILFLRRHWIIMLRLILMAIILLLAPLLIYYGVPVIQSVMDNESIFALWMLFVSSYYLFVFLFLFNNFLNYYLDIWIITNNRVISVEQKSLFTRVFSEKDLDNMQDITSSIKGFIPTLLNYGEVYIQTAAEKERFVFKQIPNADDVARRISNLVQESEHKNRSTGQV
jgi:hypothetical protein